MKRRAKRSPRKAKRILRRVRARISRKPLRKRGIRKIVESLVSWAAPRNEASPPLESPRPADFDLASQYHENKLVLLVRDPWWVYAYWEVTPAREKEVLRELLRKGLQKDKTVLRMYDVTGTSLSQANRSFDIELNFFANNWYVDVGKPDTDWIAELGIRTTHGRFFAFVRSNAVKTPRFGLSDAWDEEWMMPDELYWKLFGRMAGLSGSKSSLAMSEVLQRYLKGMVSSSSPARKS